MKKFSLTILFFISALLISYSQCPNPTVVTVEINDQGQSCSDNPITFIALSTGAGATPFYQWYLGTTPVGTNSSTYTIVPTMADHGKTIRVELTSSDACNTGIAKSNKVFLNLTQSLVPSVSIKPHLAAICSIDTWAYTTYGATGLGTDPIPNWYLNGIPLDIHGNTISVIPKNGDEIYAMVTSSRACIIGSATVQSNIITIEVADCGAFSLPISGPVFVQSGQLNVVYSVPNQAGSSYDWEVVGGTIVKGQNTNSIIVDWGEIKTVPLLQSRSQSYITLTEINAGNFTHTTILDVGPTATSIATSLSQSGITLFPNPTTESFSIKMPESGVAVSYEILDLTGATVAQGDFVSTGAAEKIAANFGAGMYQVVLRYNDLITCGRLSKVQ